MAVIHIGKIRKTKSKTKTKSRTRKITPKTKAPKAKPAKSKTKTKTKSKTKKPKTKKPAKPTKKPTKKPAKPAKPSKTKTKVRTKTPKGKRPKGKNTKPQSGATRIILDPIYPRSSIVESYGYASIDNVRGIVMSFTDDFACFYPGTTLDMYYNLKHAKSKGKHWRRGDIYDSEYIPLT